MFEGNFKSDQINNLNARVVNFLNNYLLNDPSTPQLKINAPIPAQSDLKYAVAGLNMVPKNINEQRALNCYVTVGNCLNNVQKHLKNPVKNWSVTKLLQVNPVAGVDLNAYYDRFSLKFFYYRYKGKNTYFGDSADIVTHELGHAILDALRPDFWSVSSLEIWSFHEAFSDIVALFNMMNYDLAIVDTIAKTNNNLLLSNNISKLAEEVGVLIRQVTRDGAYLPDALRDPSVEIFKYVDPNTLPKEARNNQLAAECHSFGRVFSNAWYQIFVRIFNYEISLKNSPIVAFRNARDIAFSSLLQAIPSAPRVSNFYSAIAKVMVSVAQSKGQIYSNIMNQVFVEWKILNNTQVKNLSNTSWKQVVFSLKKDDLVLKNKKSTFVCIKNNKVLKISEIPLVSTMSLSEDFDIEVPSDEYYEFDNKGNLISEMVPSDLEIKNSVSLSLSTISNNIGKNKMWNVEGGKLVRKFIS